MSSDEEDLDCPLCMEELDIADRNFRPCPCGYQICRFCWHHIKTNLNGRCPACRRLYTDQIVEFVPVSAEEIMRLKKEKKEKERQTREMRDPSRRQLSNIRVVQKNLVYVLNVSSKYASPESEIFRKFGKINKVVVSKRTLPLHGAGSTSAVGIYVTFARKEDAAKAIEELNGMEWEGKSIRASYGTTKYCTYYLRHMSCPNPNCMYLHEPGDDVDSYNKDLTSTTTTTTTATTATTSAQAGAQVATASGSGIGKHPSSSTSSSTSVNNGYPNKRPATAVKPTSTITAEVKPPPRTWAPIPKVVPITQIAKEEPTPAASTSEVVVPPTASSSSPAQPHQSIQPLLPKQPSPSLASSSKSSTLKKPPVEKTKKQPVEEVIPEKPALPATASWATASPQPVQNVITPSHFGPSLSDALNAPQKPKHQPSIKHKKEKKTKGKMLRLEEFEEAEREAKMAKPRMADILMKPAGESSRPQLDTRKVSKTNDNTRKVIVIKETDDLLDKPLETKKEEPAEELPPVQEMEPITEPVAEQQGPEVVTQDNNHDLSDNRVEEEEEEEEEEKKKEKEEKSEDVLIEEEEESTEEPSTHDIETTVESKQEITPQPEMIEIKNNNHVYLQESKNEEEESAMIDSDLMDEKSIEDVIRKDIPESSTTEMHDDQEEMLAALNNNVIKAFDHTSVVDEDTPVETENKTTVVHAEQNHVEQQPLTQQQQLLQNLSSPLVAMDRLSALVQQEIILDSDEPPREFDNNQGLYSQPPPMNRFDMGMPMHMNNRRPNMPPGLGMPPPPPPPEWMGRGGFDPFNGQDPSLVAARRLQHSQRMLEASGLFGGVPPPPPPPRFPFSPPEFNRGPPHFSPHPPPGMFPPPPNPMMRPPPPEMMGMPMMPPPPMHMENPDMNSMRNEFNAMNINGDFQSREDLRALLPNVNISFNNLQQRRAEEKEFFQSPDVRTEAQHFFGEFLRKAASVQESPKHEELKPATPFQDPAIMSVQLGEPSNEARNPLLQILGGQQPLPFNQRPMEQQPPMEQQQRPLMEQQRLPMEQQQRPMEQQRSPMEQQQRPMESLDQKSVDQSPINRQLDPRQMESQHLDFRQVDPRQMDLRQMDPRHMAPRMEFQPDPRQMDPRSFDPRHLNRMDPRMDPRFMDARMMQNNMFAPPFPFMMGPMRPPMPDLRFRNAPPGLFPESNENA